jgi:transcriptional regulator with XRE-family HTH domain
LGVQGNRFTLAKNLKKYIAKSGKDRTQVAADLGLSYSTLTDWINGNKYPRINNIEKLAAYFNVSKSELIEDFGEIKKDNDRLATIIVKLRTNSELLDVVEKLSSLDKAKLESLSRLLDTFI